ncbi:MAG: 50S ribosomal protein L22 [Patescibacteria group bacterium]
MQAQAKLRHLRMSPKKVRLIANLIKGLKVEEAINQLSFADKIAKKPILKLLQSAISNAEHNLNLKKENLFIKEIKVDSAGVLKRWQPKAHGRATPILKKLSHVYLVLEEIAPTKIKAKKVKKEKKESIKPIKVSSLKEIKEIIPEKISETKTAEPEGHDKEIDKEIIDVRMEGKHRHKQNEDKKRLKGTKGFIKKMFNRKSG